MVPFVPHGPTLSHSEEEESILLQRSAEVGGGKKRAITATTASTTKAGTEDIKGIFDSTRSAAPVPVAGGATHTLEIDTDHTRDQRALLEMQIAAQQEGVTNDDTKLYRGQAFYKNYIPKGMMMMMMMSE